MDFVWIALVATISVMAIATLKLTTVTCMKELLGNAQFVRVGIRWLTDDAPEK